MVTSAFYLAAFLSAFLLFIIQPILSKALLPAFGGSYLVWGAAMVFFQAALLAGYIFGHTAQVRIGTARYARWHALMLLFPFLFFPFRLELADAVSSMPLAPAVFIRLLAIVGGPFLTLSMTSLILQRWLIISPVPARSTPYVLYSASNAGSVLALLAYPLLIEPFLTLETQGTLWWTGYAVLVILHIICYPRRALPEPVADTAENPDAGKQPRTVWFLLSTAACAMLLAVTNVITFDVASVPMLWTLPLAIYLLAFVITFKSRLWFPPWMKASQSWAALIAALLFLMMQLRMSPPPAAALTLHLLILFVLCMNACARLSKTRPEGGTALTGFYVIIAFGGLCGGVLVSWVIPQLSSTLVEYILAIALALLASGLADHKTSGVPCRLSVRTWRHFTFSALLIAAIPTACYAIPFVRQLPSSLLFAAAALPVALLLRGNARQPIQGAWIIVVLAVTAGPLQKATTGGHHLLSLRNYYGIYNVFDRDNQRFLQHGTTQHGRQYTTPELASTPIGYYHPSTPAAALMIDWGDRFANIGMVGLGTGALAAYAAEGHTFTIFELDPDNLTIAERYFSYLEQGRQQGARIEFVFGDGRITLRDQPAGSLDLLVIDAFNSGSIPVHLMTVEAFDEYFRALGDDGLLLLHISNKILDLTDVIYANAAAGGYYACEQSNQNNLQPDAEITNWMALHRKRDMIEALKKELLWYERKASETSMTAPWTDRYSNILKAVRWLH